MNLYRATYTQNNIQYSIEVKADSELEAKQEFWKHFRYSDGIKLVIIIKL